MQIDGRKIDGPFMVLSNGHWIALDGGIGTTTVLNMLKKSAIGDKVLIDFGDRTVITLVVEAL